MSEFASFDINADMGEWSEAAGASRDREIMPCLTACNIACGGHAGDDSAMEQTLLLAKEHRVEPGAHPSYPDREGFGRVRMEMAADELARDVRSQVERLRRIAAELGMRIRHVKPHGALYHEAASVRTVADLLVRTFTAMDSGLRLIGPPGSELEHAAKRANQPFHAEAFADRVYEEDLTLRPRQFPDALHTRADPAVRQVREIVRRGRVRTVSGVWKPLRAQTVCIHSDTPGAVEIARAVHQFRKSHERRRTH